MFDVWSYAAIPRHWTVTLRSRSDLMMPNVGVFEPTSCSYFHLPPSGSTGSRPLAGVDQGTSQTNRYPPFASVCSLQSKKLAAVLWNQETLTRSRGSSYPMALSSSL